MEKEPHLASFEAFFLLRANLPPPGAEAINET
jgi:hypothetical protein